MKRIKFTGYSKCTGCNAVVYVKDDRYRCSNCGHGGLVSEEIKEKKQDEFNRGTGENVIRPD